MQSAKGSQFPPGVPKLLPNTHTFPLSAIRSLWGCARSQKRSVGMSVRKLVIPGKKIHVDTRERERVLELKSFILQGLFSQNMSNNYALLSYCTDK